MSKHTPGPWVIVHHQSRKTGTSFVTIAPEGDVQTPLAEVYGGDWGSSRNKREANARFIVQACNSHEELLEAAIAMLEAFGNEAWFDEPAEAINKLINAILKAEGRE